MTKEEFYQLYNKTVYQVRLETAQRLVASHLPRRALREADQLIDVLLQEDFQQAMESYNGKEVTSA
jgi:hypothetical protein